MEKWYDLLPIWIAAVVIILAILGLVALDVWHTRKVDEACKKSVGADTDIDKQPTSIVECRTIDADGKEYITVNGIRHRVFSTKSGRKYIMTRNEVTKRFGCKQYIDEKNC